MARKMDYKGKYKLSRAEFNRAKWFALSFNDWMDEYNALKDSVSAINYENGDMPHAVNKTSNPTENLATRRAELKQKMDIVVECCNEADAALSEYILKAVTNENVTYQNLKVLLDIPCGATLFYEKRRKFYWLLAKEI